MTAPLAADYTKQGLDFHVQAGDLSVRLARTAAEVEAAQRLRYRVFYEEMSATASATVTAEKRDADPFDAYCHHLLVLHHNADTGAEDVVGTYRLLNRATARQQGGFYTANEFDLSCFESYPGEVMELGRSCVAAEYRNGKTMQLLWRGIASYVFALDIEIMFGCASLPGADLAQWQPALSYLYQNHLSPANACPKALPDLYTPLRGDDLSPETLKAGLKSLPPLVKGYLRLGGTVGDGAVIDRAFDTVDVCMVVQTHTVTDRYYKHYEREAQGTD